MGDHNNKALLMKAAAAVDGKKWNDEDVPSKKSASVCSNSSDDEGGPTTSESVSSAGASGTKQESKTEKKKEQATPLKVCTYRDYSNHVSPEPVLAKKMAGTLAINKTLPAKEPTFPVKLHMILSNSSLESIISWLPHGRSWRILQQSEFEEKVIPLYFRYVVQCEVFSWVSS